MVQSTKKWSAAVSKQDRVCEWSRSNLNLKVSLCLCMGMMAYSKPGPTVVAIEFKGSEDKAQLLQGSVANHLFSNAF